MFLLTLTWAVATGTNASQYNNNNATSLLRETRNYCGTDFADANNVCRVSCTTDVDCGQGENCYAKCTNCKVNPSKPPAPAPAPTPTLRPYIMKGCPTTHPPGGIGVQCAKSIALVWHSGGGDAATCQLAVSVALAESGGDAHVQGPNSDGSIDRGLWQLNSRWHPEVADSCAYDPECNCKQTLRISKQGTDFSTWVTYQQGINSKFLSIAGQGCTGYTPGPAPHEPTPSPPGPAPGPSPSGTCHAIAPSVTDDWCNSNCNHKPPNCPSALCRC
jgi:hypothetical protein